MRFRRRRSELSAADLKELVSRLIENRNTPVNLRNECHRLMIAIERNDKTLIEEQLVRVEQLAALTGS
jgi:hypothetical protein